MSTNTGFVDTFTGHYGANCDRKRSQVSDIMHTLSSFPDHPHSSFAILHSEGHRYINASIDGSLPAAGQLEASGGGWSDYLCGNSFIPTLKVPVCSFTLASDLPTIQFLITYNIQEQIGGGGKHGPFHHVNDVHAFLLVRG